MKLDRLLIIGLIIGFAISVVGLLFMASCEKDLVAYCLLEKEYLMPDFYWHSNTIKYVANNWILPYQVLGYEDGGVDGSSVSDNDDEMKNVIHGPLYYYISAIIWSVSSNLEINQVLMLHVLSIFLMLLTNIMFFLLTKKISKYTAYKKQFIISSTLIFIFFPLNLYLSLAVHNHALFLFFLILSFYLYQKLIEQKNLKNSVFLGVSLGLGLLSSSMILSLFLAVLFYHLFSYFLEKDRNLKFILFSLFLGFVIGAYSLIRNYILYGESIWGGIVAPLQERNFFTLIRIGKSFFSGIYGGNNLISPLIFVISVLIIMICIYGVFYWLVEQKRNKFSKPNAINLILLTGLITLILSFHTVCNFTPLLTNLTCFGDILHGRHLLAIIPSVVISFAVGLTNLLKRQNTIKSFLVGIVCFLYSLDFISSLMG